MRVTVRKGDLGTVGGQVSYQHVPPFWLRGDWETALDQEVIQVVGSMT